VTGRPQRADEACVIQGDGEPSLMCPGSGFPARKAPATVTASHCSWNVPSNEGPGAWSDAAMRSAVYAAAQPTGRAKLRSAEKLPRRHPGTEETKPVSDMGQAGSPRTRTSTYY